MNAREAARLIDISAVRTHHALKDIEENVAYAKQYQFINVHVLPSWIQTLAPMLEGVDGVYVGSPCGFPSGASATETKLCEAKQMIRDGVQEMDIVMNVGKFKNKEYDYVLDELKQIIALVPKHVMTKVIIELNCLDDDELEAACDIVVKSGADFLKTGTGWVPGGANVERIAKIKEYLKGTGLKVKASGGIRTKEEFMQLCELGVERFGINTKSAIEIVQSLE